MISEMSFSQRMQCTVQYGEETWWRSMTNEAPFKSEGEFGSFAEAASFIEPLAQSYGSFWEHKRTMRTTGMTVQH